MMTELGFIPTFDNPNYLVNPQTGEVKSVAKGKVLEGTIHRDKFGKAKYVYYSITKDGVVKKLKGHRIVAEAVLKRKLDDVVVGHKNGIMTMNNFDNLMIGKQKWGGTQYRVHEFFKGEYKRTYLTIEEFQRQTGMYGYQFKKKGKDRELKAYAYTWLISDDF